MTTDHATPPSREPDTPRDAFEAAMFLLDRRHTLGCSFYTPDARCSCGLHAAKSALRAAFNLAEEAVRPPLAAQPLRKFDPASEERAKLALYTIGNEMGYGWAQAVLGKEWELRHDCAPRGRMGVTAKDAEDDARYYGFPPQEPPAAPADDLVERLRKPVNWLRQEAGPWKDATSYYDRAPYEAADAIAELRADRDSWQQQASDRVDDALRFARERDEARDERDKRAVALLDCKIERDRLRAALRPFAQIALDRVSLPLDFAESVLRARDALGDKS